MFRVVFIILNLLLFISIVNASQEGEQAREKPFCLHVEKRSEESGAVTHCSLCEEPGNAERVLISCDHCGGQVHGDCIRSGAYMPICPTVGCEKPIQLVAKKSTLELPENQKVALMIAEQQADKVIKAIKKYKNLETTLEQSDANSEATPILKNMLAITKLEIQQLLEQLYSIEYKFSIYPSVLSTSLMHGLFITFFTSFALFLDYLWIKDGMKIDRLNVIILLVTHIIIGTIDYSLITDYYKNKNALTYVGSFKDILNKILEAQGYIPKNWVETDPSKCSINLLSKQNQKLKEEKDIQE